MARSWLITCRGVAKKIRNDNCSNRQISELGAEACRECPNCKYIIDNSDVAVQWPGLPAGVKFDPSDLELLEHLEQKIGVGGSEPHMFLDEFIPTVENDEGICYSHPENLPGTKKMEEALISSIQFQMRMVVASASVEGSATAIIALLMSM